MMKTLPELIALAGKCATYKEFRVNHPADYYHARKLNMVRHIRELFKDVPSSARIRSDKDLIQLALSHPSLHSLRKVDQSAYSLIYRRGLQSRIRWLRESSHPSINGGVSNV